MPYQDLSVGMPRAPLSGNPIKKWAYKGDKMGRQHYKDMNLRTAMKGENPIGKKFPYFGTNPNYKGYNLGYQGPDKTNFLGKEGYLRQGLGKSIANSNIGGGTTGSRYLYEKAARLGKFAGRGVPVLGNAFMVGDLAYQGTNAVIDTMDWRDNLQSAGGTIWDWTHRR